MSNQKTTLFKNNRRAQITPKHFFTADFETITTPELNAVHRWGLLSSDPKISYKEGWKIDEFIDLLRATARSGREKANFLFFHNGSNFDFHFILKALNRKKGFQQRPFLIKKNKKPIIKSGEKYYKPSPYKLANSFEKENLPEIRDGDFEFFADSGKKIYQLEIYFTKNIKGFLFKKPRKWLLYCSALLFPGMSLEKMGEILNKHNKNEKFTKGKIPFRKIDYLDKKDFEQDIEMAKYLRQDCEILKTWMLETTKFAPLKSLECTRGRIAYERWNRDFVFNEKTLSLLGIKKIQSKKDKNFNKKYLLAGKKYGNKEIRRKVADSFLPTDWLTKEIKEGETPGRLDYWWWLKNYYYRGGLTLTNPAEIGKLNKNIDLYDINSSYPNVMLNRDYPLGEPVPDEQGELFFYEVYIKIAKNKKGLPFYPFPMEKSQSVEYPKIIINKTIYITCAEWQEFQKNYVGKWAKPKIYLAFKKISGRFLFGETLDKQYEIKKNPSANVFAKTIAKLTMNSLYGKFATNNTKESKIFVGKWEKPKTNQNIKTDWEPEIMTEKTRFYLPIAIFITAYGRLELVKAVGEQYDKVITCDTDSLAVKKSFKLNFPVGKKIGEWKKELSNKWDFAARKKCYVMWDWVENPKIAIAGFHIDKKKADFEGEKSELSGQELSAIPQQAYNRRFSFDFRDIIDGFIIESQLRKQETKRGVALIERAKELKPIYHKDHIYPSDTWFKDSKGKNSKKKYDNYLKKNGNFSVNFCKKNNIPTKETLRDLWNKNMFALIKTLNLIQKIKESAGGK